jgi:hypothetical protein
VSGFTIRLNEVGGRRAGADQKVLDEISFIRIRLPIPAAEANSHGANMHLISAGREIERSLRAVSEGDIIELRGSLVEVTAPDGWHWRSSLTRTNYGQGACELMWVTRLDILPL